MREIKFRVWAIEAKKWIDVYSFCLTPNGLWPFGISPETVIIQQFTGLLDKKDKEIFEGDIIKFKYITGDNAWENMSEKETKENLRIEGKTFVGRIAPNPVTPINLEIVVGESPAPCMFFPLSYAIGSRVIGNIFEHGDLL